MYQDRIELYRELEKEFDSRLLVYVTSDRVNMGAQIAQDVIDLFVEQLDKIGVCKNISLYLYTRGGDTAAAWNIINLLRMYCDELKVIVPHKAHSAGTIISLGANQIIMTKQATLGPIDPSINTPLNPEDNRTLKKYPVSVEAVKGYLEFAREELKIQDDNALANIMIKLSEYVHPLVLGQVYRSKAQIQMLAEKLLINQFKDDKDEKIKKVVSFLCSESGSHDYTINRREAEDYLGLNIIKPTEEQYRLIKRIYDDICNELQLTKAFKLSEINGCYTVRRGLLESVIGGSDYFVSEGECIHGIDEYGNEIIKNTEIFDGWRHDCFVNTDCVNGKVEGDVFYERGEDFRL